jgi:putative restriction endonuclease
MVTITRASHWLAKLSKLRVDRARGDAAPHKPLLLLVLCDLVEKASLPHDVLPLSPELAFRFYTYWSIVVSRRPQRPDIRLPFHHLAGDGIWSVLDEHDAPSPDRKMTRYAKLPSDLIAFLEDPANRDRARHLLIAKYFRASEQIALYAMIGLPLPSRQEIEQNAAYKSPEEAQLAGREARFRIRVVSAYNFTCALSAYRLTTITAGSIVDAAHIHGFRDSRNNEPRNGIALSKNAHWTFDQGLWTIADDYRIIVAIGHFAEAGPNEDNLLQSYHGRRLNLPEDKTLWPDPIHLVRHRKEKFGAA